MMSVQTFMEANPMMGTPTNPEMNRPVLRKMPPPPSPIEAVPTMTNDPPSFEPDMTGMADMMAKVPEDLPLEENTVENFRKQTSELQSAVLKTIESSQLTVSHGSIMHELTTESQTIIRIPI